LVGILVLMSASAAASQGVQNLALGLKQRRYIPPSFGQQNMYEVADRPVWLMVGIVVVSYLLFGTDEETYLAIYAAGVFILLSMTGWAVTKRLIRELRAKFEWAKAALIGGTILAALLTSASTVIIFEERFSEGAWTFFIFVPMLYAVFTYFRNRLGEPDAITDYLGQLDAAQLAGFGFGQLGVGLELDENGDPAAVPLKWEPAPIEESKWRKEKLEINEIAVLLDGSHYAQQALPMAELISKQNGAKIFLLSSVKDYNKTFRDKYEETKQVRTLYLERVAKDLRAKNFDVEISVRSGFIAEATKSLIDDKKIDLVIISDRGKSASNNWESGGATVKLMRTIQVPVIIIPTVEKGEKLPDLKINRLMLGLDGSIRSEAALPYARELAKLSKAELLLLPVPAVPETDKYRAAAGIVEQVREKAVNEMGSFLEAVAESLRAEGLQVRPIVTGVHPARTIVSEAEKQAVDMVLLTSRGRGGVDLLFTGSVAERVVNQSKLPVLIVPTSGNSKK